MSKNLTRKGLAFGAIVALGTTLFAGAPALAAGIDNGNVSLAPAAGAEYDILAGSQFDLKSNFSNAAKSTGAWLKFLVEDSAAKTTALATGSSRYSVTAGAAGSAAWAVSGSGTSTVVTVTTAAAHSFKVGDKITNASFGVSAADANVNGSFTIDTVPSSTTFTYKPGSSVTATPANGAGTVSLNPSYGVTRGTGTSYVFDTKSDTNLADKTLRLASTDEDATQSVTVTAWIDQNDNGLIDTTEYQSPARTVRFLKQSDVTSNVTWTPITVGTDTTVEAKVTFTPTLNGSQLIASNNRTSAAGAVNVNFTRPGSTKAVAGATVAYSNTTKAWTVTSVDLGNNTSNNTDASAAAAGWNITQPALFSSLAISSAQVKKDVVTVTTGTTEHGLQVGDYVVISGAATTKTWVNGTVKVTSVPTTTKFTYTSATTGLDDDATTTAPGGSPVIAANIPATGANHTQGTHTAVTGVTGSKILRNFAVAGDYTAQVLLYKGATTAALTKLGSAVSSSAVTVTAASAAISAVGSSTVSATVSNATSIYTGTTSANFVVKVLDADGAAVGAGIDAVITATTVTSAGTVKINGTTVITGTTVAAKTDAKGQVAIALENSSALAAEAVVLDFDIQGVDAPDVTATWGGKVYSILDLNDQTAAGTARNRAVADGAAYTFNFLVQDQFKAPAGDDIRLVVASTGNTVSTNTVALTAGKATVAIADGGLTAGAATVSVNVQKLTAGVWAAITDASAIEWDGPSGEDIAPVAINYYTQTDAITLNADAANYPSSVVADLAATATAETLAALDLRVSNGEAAPFVAANKAVVSGKVAHATTGAGKAGAVVSFSGKGLLFKSGDVWSLDSATALSNDGTFSVEVYSSGAGDKVVTIAVGSVTKTATVAYTGLGASKTNKLSAVAGSALVQAGRTVDYTATVTDKLGNPVEGFALKATISGAGYFAGSVAADGSVAVTTDKYGKAVVKALFGSNDLGTATVTFADNDASTATADNLTDVVLNTEVGTTEADVTVGGRAIFASAEFAKGKTVTVTIDGKRVYSKLQSSDTYTELKFTQKKAGKHTVTVRISGGIVYSEVVTTK